MRRVRSPKPAGYFARMGLVGLLGLLAAGCATKTFATQTEFPDESPTVLLVRPDVTLYEMSAGGAITAKADWTSAAQDHIRTTLADSLRGRDVAVEVSIDYDSDRMRDETAAQLHQLHAAVGQSILANQINQATRLPTKETFDWSLGPAVRHYAEKYDADYALFLHVDDSYSSDGRRAAIIMAAVLFGVALPGGEQSAFASLVDLESGNVVWFNRVKRGTGDLREVEPARETIQTLLRGFPA